MQKAVLNREALISALEQTDFSDFYRTADRIRSERKGDEVHIRALLEFSNHCRRQCRYCGLNCTNTSLPRYRMKSDDIVSLCRQAVQAGYRTVVLQSGEDRSYSTKQMCELVYKIKELGVFVTLSIGELPRQDLSQLRSAGADRYLLKHETSSEEIYSSLHPCGTLDSRINCLKDLKELGFEVGGGFMIGLPGQTLGTIADDLLLLKEIGCDMAGIGPFLPHPMTQLKDHPPGSAELTRRAVALARILMPDINLPATTSLSVLNPSERDMIFSGGANVIMQKVTPTEYRRMYEIYPTPESVTDVISDRKRVEERIKQLGRIPV